MVRFQHLNKVIMTQIKTGRFTLPAESGMEKETLDLAKKWGADAVRDSDGTVLSPEITELDFDILSTLCMIRADQEWNTANRNQCQQKYLMSDPLTAESDTLVVELMSGYSREQFEVDAVNDAKKYWEVIDRTTGEVVDSANWSFSADAGTVTITKAKAWHLYTVNFLVFQIWESTSMYNHITNNWTSPHQLGIDPFQPETRAHLLIYLEKWLDEHPNTDIVRFTSVAYQFPIVKNEDLETRWQDWCSYRDCISAYALDEFEKKKGYRLTSEDLVDKGYYNATDRVPTKAYLDWMDFVNEFTTDFAREWVEKVHARGKKAIMFFCDHWIGTEPYGERFESMGFDGLVNPVINGNELRRMSDAPTAINKEVRFYPYFFPVNLVGDPLFEGEGGDPVGECQLYWAKVRRAMLRKQVDRIGYGGYLHLAVKFPEFLDAVEVVANEFRQILEHADKGAPYAMKGKVLILSAWGKLRSWMVEEEWPSGEFTEALSGLPVDVEFISFDEIKANGIPADTSVIISYGKAETSYSGGTYWTDPQVVELVRGFVAAGGGFVGVGEPTAIEHQGRLLQLEDVFGVQRATNMNIRSKMVVSGQKPDSHFITADLEGSLDLGELCGKSYPLNSGVEVLAEQDGHISLAANSFGKGRSVYLPGFKLNSENTRLVLRALYWASNQEDSYQYWTTSNIETECSAFVEAGYCAVTNHSGEAQTTQLSDGSGQTQEVSLAPYEMKWVTV